ncbi:hypothetical protein HK102_012719 [Quaeritorhiza haematococci]|nr:hypothetical protein HK102_012719 [Quaeritorhiza haematococci]
MSGHKKLKATTVDVNVLEVRVSTLGNAGRGSAYETGASSQKSNGNNRRFAPSSGRPTRPHATGTQTGISIQRPRHKSIRPEDQWWDPKANLERERDRPPSVRTAGTVGLGKRTNRSCAPPSISSSGDNLHPSTRGPKLPRTDKPLPRLKSTFCGGTLLRKGLESTEPGGGISDDNSTPSKKAHSFSNVASDGSDVEDLLLSAEEHLRSSQETPSSASNRLPALTLSTSSLRSSAKAGKAQTNSKSTRKFNASECATRKKWEEPAISSGPRPLSSKRDKPHQLFCDKPCSPIAERTKRRKQEVKDYRESSDEDETDNSDDDDDFVEKPPKKKRKATKQKKQRMLSGKMGSKNGFRESNGDIDGGKGGSKTGDRSSACSRKKPARHIEDVSISNDKKKARYSTSPDGSGSSRRSREATVNSNKVESSPVCPHCGRPVTCAFNGRLSSLYARAVKPRHGNSRGTIGMAQFEFCRLHDAYERVIPEGKAEGYPETLDKGDIQRRIRDLRPELESIIRGENQSVFREMALEVYKALGTRRAKGNGYKINRVGYLSCGYYGNKGQRIIMKTVWNMFVHANPAKGSKERAEEHDHSPILTSATAHPQSVVEYVQDVLVPETALRLIAKDRNITLKEAKKVMAESSEFGTFVHDGDSSDDDEYDNDLETSDRGR